MTQTPMTDVAAAPRLEVEEQTFSTEIEGKTLEIGVGLLAQNATAACTIRYGDTVLLATLTDGEPRAGIDFFPLTVDFEERMYAIGKIPGSFFRREGRPGNEATLAARMTDRPIRPLFPKGYRREIQLVLLTLSSDRENPSDIFGVLGASTTLGMSHVPFEAPSRRSASAASTASTRPSPPTRRSRRPTSTSSSRAPRTRS